MAVMTAQQIDDLMAQWMRDNRIQVDGCTKANLRAAFVAIDQFLSDNATTMNAALPLPARTALSTPAKASMLSATSNKRWGAGV
jgi:hypothetical protein